jgi:hypothetical protein
MVKGWVGRSGGPEMVPLPPLLKFDELNPISLLAGSNNILTTTTENLITISAKIVSIMTTRQHQGCNRSVQSLEMPAE